MVYRSKRALADALNASRTVADKAVENLVRQGKVILDTSNGYRLAMA